MPCCSKEPDPDITKEICINENQENYLNVWMNEVSRSFALVTPCFEKPLDNVMSLSYLMCRVVDNIEDCIQPMSWKRLRYIEFSRLLKEPSNAQEVLAGWGALDWPGLTADETKMMNIEDGRALWQIYAQLPEKIQSIIGYWCSVMAKGMEDTENPDRPPSFVNHSGVHVLAGVSDYNLYCYYVAGTVGRMTTELVASYYGLSYQVTNDLSELSVACGRGLQKTNIIKDFPKDLARGMCYLPSEWMQKVMYSPLTLEGAPKEWKLRVLKDVLTELDHFVSAITILPQDLLGYRLACLMCILPALQTIFKAARSQDKLFTPDHNIKISKITFLGCIRDAQLMASNNEAIMRYSHKVESEIYREFSRNQTVCMIESKRDESCLPTVDMGMNENTN